MNTGQREVACLKFQAHQTESDNIKNMNEALLQVFLASIGDSCKKHLESSFIGRIDCTFQEILTPS